MGAGMSNSRDQKSVTTTPLKSQQIVLLSRQRNEATMRDHETQRLVRAIKTFVDRHLEYVKTENGSRLLWVGMMPDEMKELRASLEPFRIDQ